VPRSGRRRFQLRDKGSLRQHPRGNMPKWDLYVQLLKPEDVDKLDYNAFDATKIWDGIAETKLGTMTLNRVPENFFQSTELAAFSPA